MALNNPVQEKIIDALNGTYIDNKILKLGTPLTENTNIEGTTQSFSISSNLSGTAPDYFKFLIGDLGGQDAIQLFYDGTILNEATAQITINDEANISLFASNASTFAEIFLDPFGSARIRVPNGVVEVTEDGIGLLGIKVLVDTDETNEGLTGFYDYSPNYTSLSYVQKGYVDNLVSTSGQSFSEQTHISGATVTIDDNTTILYVDPASLLAALTITLPATPVNGQEVKISYGGSITTGPVVTTLIVEGNAGHSVLGGVTITTADAGDGYIFKFQSSTNLWRIF